MKKAIDNYSIGKQRESSADDFKKYMHESYPRGRFTCPECGEDVHIAKSKYSNHFSHYKKTEISIECDKRVDGKSGITIYERIGLPIYLRKTSNGFSLFMGFRSISEEILNNAVNEQTYIEITHDGLNEKSKKLKYFVSAERFSSKSATFLQLDFIPSNNHKYRIIFSKDSIASVLKKQWADYADGFSKAGALFTITEQGGKKIRQGDSVSINTEYYWVRRNLDMEFYFEGISMKFCGSMKLSGIKYYVFLGSFNTSVAHTSHFLKLSSFLKEYLNVSLLDKQPEIFPIWPPCVRKGDTYESITDNRDINCIVKTGNEEPKVFAYYENFVNETPLNVQKLGNSIYLTKINVTERQMLINVDRKITGAGLLFRRGHLGHYLLGGQISLADKLKNDENYCLHEKINTTELKFEARTKVEIICMNKNNIEKTKITNEINKNVLLKNLENEEKIFIFAHHHLLYHAVVTIESLKNESLVVYDRELFQLLLKSSKSKLVCIPTSIRIIMSELINNTEKSKSLLQYYLNLGKMPEAVIRFLLHWRSEL